MTASHHSSTCFVCGQHIDRAGLNDILTDLACIKCKGRTRLLATNVELSTLLASTRPYPLQGSGLNAILNPVVIDERRAWADFAAVGFEVFSEHKRSTDWFDFVVQHVEPGPRVLCRIREQGLLMEPPAAVITSITQELIGGGNPWLSPADRLTTWWQLARAGASALAVVGPIRSNADAWAAADALATLIPTFSESELAEMVRRLWALASSA